MIQDTNDESLDSEGVLPLSLVPAQAVLLAPRLASVKIIELGIDPGTLRLLGERFTDATPVHFL